jgi:hypothetical protein
MKPSYTEIIHQTGKIVKFNLNIVVPGKITLIKIKDVHLIGVVEGGLGNIKIHLELYTLKEREMNPVFKGSSSSVTHLIM